jgi:gamma-glutamyltranspeptidase/glutathione hydrolase
LAKEFAEEHISKIRMDGLLDLPNVAPPMNPSTVYITVVDKDRNVCSFINSIAHSFGSAIVSNKTGVLLQNRAGGFRISPATPIASRLASGRCTRSSRALPPRTAAR